MRVELRPIVHLTEREAQSVEEARRALYTCGSRGPHFDNKAAGYLDGWSFKRAASVPELRGTEWALSHELYFWQQALKARRETFRQHPEYRTYHGFRDTQPEHYAALVRTLKTALSLIRRALNASEFSCVAPACQNATKETT